MFLFKFNQVIFFFIFHGYDCQRRIKDGTVVTDEKRYVVYLIEAPTSPRYYSGWLCGGALVSTKYIVTSAACVMDVTHLYAIAGYNKYIKETDFYTDLCTKNRKKKIVFICAPKDYELVYTQPEKWSNIDIAMVEVESPYDFNDASYTEFCSYMPAPIEINFESKYQEAGIDAIVLGWGHRNSYREELDLTNNNQAFLNYAPTSIEEKEECKKEYQVYAGMDEVIDQYMICTNEKGNLNDVGAVILQSQPTAQGCKSSLKRLHGELFCENAGVPEDQVVLIENSRKNVNPTNLSRNDAGQKSNYLNSKININIVDSYNTHNSSLINKMNKTVLNSRRSNTRRNGICQNDHGGPLVTWVGAHEKLIGVASAYKISESRECIGPYLYTSTQCNGAFLACFLNSDEPVRRGICKSLLNEQGLDLFEKNISWEDHPDGPAENEKNGTAETDVNRDTNNVTVKLITPKEKRNKTYQENKATKFVYTNITNTNYTTATHSIIDTNLTKTTKAINLGTPMNLTNINSTNINSTNQINNTFTTLTNMDTTTTKITSTKYQTNAAMNNIENTKTTILTKNATTNHRYTTNTNLRDTTTTNTNLIKNATLTTINLVNTTSRN